MTKRQLQKLSDRVTEIESIIDLCSDYDDDILDNLDNELLNIINELEYSLSEIKPCHLKLVS